MSKTIIAVRHFGLGGRESLETAVTIILLTAFNNVASTTLLHPILGLVILHLIILAVYILFCR